jgi:acyl-CoA synthetase (AMP-forming)/AMP-acid ligase II
MKVYELMTGPCFPCSRGMITLALAHRCQHDCNLLSNAMTSMHPITHRRYGQILTASEDVARLLSKHGQASTPGSPHGPRIGLVAAPGPEYVAATWAIWQSGGIAVPLATSHPARELQYVLEDAGISQVSMLGPVIPCGSLRDAEPACMVA